VEFLAPLGWEERRNHHCIAQIYRGIPPGPSIAADWRLLALPHTRSQEFGQRHHKVFAAVEGHFLEAI